MSLIFVWISGYENLYKINPYGDVFSCISNRILQPNISGIERKTIGLTKNKKIKYFFIHRLIAINFIPNPKNLTEVIHLDNDKLNNNLSNLKWVSKSFIRKNKTSRNINAYV